MENSSYFAHDTHKYMYCADGVFSDFVFSLIKTIVPDNFSQYAQVYEMGAGMGRFSFALVKNFPRVSLIEPSESYARVLRELFDTQQVSIVNMTMEEFFKKNTIAPNSIFFNFHLLHHLSPAQRTEYFSYLCQARVPAVFLEPNPWNPLIVFQLMINPDMRMKNEWQYLTLTRTKLSREFNTAGLSVAAYGKLCQVPPPIAKRAVKVSVFKRSLLFLDHSKYLLPFLSSYHLFYTTPRQTAMS